MKLVSAPASVVPVNESALAARLVAARCVVRNAERSHFRSSVCGEVLADQNAVKTHRITVFKVQHELVSMAGLRKRGLGYQLDPRWPCEVLDHLTHVALTGH